MSERVAYIHGPFNDWDGVDVCARCGCQMDGPPIPCWTPLEYKAAISPPLPSSSCRHGINPDECEFCDGPGADKEEATRQAIRAQKSAAIPPENRCGASVTRGSVERSLPCGLERGHAGPHYFGTPRAHPR